jgi:Transcription initiation factor TFIID, subunit TAF1
MVAPESVCAYESMLVGMHRLHEMGIERLTHPPGISTTSNFFASHEKNEQFKAQLRILEEELHLTTWNLTSSFVSAMTGSLFFSLIIRII